MADKRGINPYALGRAGNTAYGAIPFMQVVTIASTDTAAVKAFGNTPVPFQMRVVRAFGYMTQAGSASDTVVVQRVRSGTTTSITNTADLSVMSDTDQFDFGQIDNAANVLNKGDTLQVTPAGGTGCVIYIECLREA